MSMASIEMKEAASKLATVKPQDVQQIAMNTNEFVNKAKSTSIELQKVITLLQSFGGTTSTSSRPTKKFPWSFPWGR